MLKMKVNLFVQKFKVCMGVIFWKEIVFFSTMRIILSSRFASYIQNEVHFCINIFTFHHVLFDCTICIHWNTAYRDIRWGQWNCRGYCVNCITINNWTWKCLGDWKWTTIDISWCLGIDRFTRTNKFETIISYNQESKNSISLWTKTHLVPRNLIEFVEK